MKKQIINIAPIQTAKVFALLYFMLSIPLVALMSITFLFSPARPPIVLLIAMPLAYLAFGFVFTAIGAWAYNFVAGWVGGIEYISSEQPET